MQADAKQAREVGDGGGEDATPAVELEIEGENPGVGVESNGQRQPRIAASAAQ